MGVKSNCHFLCIFVDENRPGRRSWWCCQWSSLHLPLFQHLLHPFFSNLGLGFSTQFPTPRALLSQLQSFHPINAFSLQSIFPETSLPLPWSETMLPLRRLCQSTLVNTNLNFCSSFSEILDFPMRLNAFWIIFRC